MALSLDQQRQVLNRLQEVFEQALEKIEGYGRGLSRWEEDCLTRVLAAMTCMAYSAAARELEYFAEHCTQSVDDSLEVSRLVRRRPFNIADLRLGLANFRVGI